MEIIQWLDAHAGSVQAVATIVLVAVTIVYAWRTHAISKATAKQADASVKMADHMREQSYSRVLDAIHQILGDPEVVAARRFCIGLLDDFDVASLTEYEIRQIELVTRSFDRAGFYLWCKFIPEEYVLPEYPGAIWHWKKLKHYVNKQREKEGYKARIFFEYMAAQTEKFRKERNVQAEGGRVG